MATIEFKSVRKLFESQLIVPDLNLSIASGEFVALVGPSGCGKSTILRMLAGLEEPSGGQILIDGRDVTNVNARDRGVAMVFQSYALYPHMTVAENVAFPLKMARAPRADVERKTREIAEMLDLTALLDRKPAQLSGGQKQRVAMGRALAKSPRVLLFDEPLSNLDAQLRVRVRSEIAALHKRVKSTIVYVTHDQVEAMTLADRIVILNKGVIEQIGSPLEVYGEPRSKFVASFIGTPPMNFVAAQSARISNLPARAVTVGFRPEATSLRPTSGAAVGDGDVEIGNGRVSLIEPLGATTHWHVDLTGRKADDTLPENVVVELRGYHPGKLGEECSVHTRRNALFFFDGDGRRLGID